MKKFISMLVAMLMVIAMLPAVTMAAGTAETIFVRCDNITLPEGSTTFTYTPVGGAWYSVLSDNGTNLPLITTANMDSYATATIVVDGNNGGEKTYYVWALAQKGRPTGVAFDSSTSFTRLNTYDSADSDTVSNGKGMAWSATTGSGFSLTPGVHTMKIRQDSPNTTNVQGFIITDDANFKPVIASTTYDYLKANAFIDTTAPEFAADAAIQTSFDGSVCSITFPKANDGDNTALYYEYTLNGNTAAIANITESVNVGSIAEDTTVTLTVYDKLGNKAEKTFDITAPEADPDEPVISDAERILLGCMNFELPSNGNIALENKHNGRTNQLINGQDLKINWNATEPATAKVYIEKEGTYYMWVLDSSNADNAADRYPAAGFDGDTVDFTVSSKAAFQWCSASEKSWTLTKGWHEVQLKDASAGTTCYVNAVYITDDSSFIPNVATDDDLLAYHDTEAPVFEASADVETSFEDGVLNVTFPEADDDNDVIYEYTVGSTTSIIENISSPVAVRGLVGTDELILTASDKWGNSTTKTFTVTAPRTKWMLTWNNFVKPDFTSWTYQNSTSLVNKSIQPNTLSTDSVASSNAKAKASFYVENAGNYAVWVLSKNGKISDGRTAKIYVDGVSDQTAYNDSTSFVWGKGTGPENGNGYWTLAKGWHTVEFGLSTAWKPYDLNAIYITSDLTETVTTDNDDNLLAAYGDSSVKINDELYMACGLEKAGYAVEDSSINIVPVKGVNTTDAATVSVNNTSAAWDTAASVALNKGVNTVTVDSSDDSADCSFKIASTGKVINHRDTDALITGGVESTIVGVDGVTNAVYLDNVSSKATFSAEGITGNAKVYVYIVGAEGKDSSVAATADVVVNDSKGATNKKPDTSRTVGSWTDLGTYNFSGSEDEYIEIQGQDGAHVYIDSVKFVYTDEYIVSAPVVVNADGKVKYTYECYKQTDSQAAPVAIIAEYDADTKVMNNVSVNNPSHNEKGFYTISTNALDSVSGAEYRSFIWDSIGKLVPLR